MDGNVAYIDSGFPKKKVRQPVTEIAIEFRKGYSDRHEKGSG